MTGTGLEKTDGEPALGVPDPSRAARGTITDYVSGQRVKATPEEADAVQVFSRRLVEDYGYPKAHLRTRPQYRVKPTPSGSGKSCPIDNAVFAGPAPAPQRPSNRGRVQASDSPGRPPPTQDLPGYVPGREPHDPLSRSLTEAA